MNPKLTDIRIDDVVSDLGRVPKILIIDDEESMTSVLEVAFSVVGYNVRTYACTETAARHVVRDGEDYDVVLSDFNNKHASGDHEGGLTLYRTLEREGKIPPLYVIISGQDSLSIPEGVPFMRKPVGLYELAQRVTVDLSTRLSRYQRAAPEAK